MIDSGTGPVASFVSLQISEMGLPSSRIGLN